MPQLKGIITSPVGEPLSGATITLTSLHNQPGILRGVYSHVTTLSGEYDFPVLPGVYSVRLTHSSQRLAEIGVIRVYMDSRDGSLNDFLGATEIDLRPESLRRFEELADKVQENADTAASSSQQAVKILEAIQNIAGNISGLRYENFTDILSRCTTAMLKLEQPEVVDTSISLKIKENIDFNYVGAVNGYCDISEPEKYKVEMYAYTT
ncbi:prophage tail fiber N-terminal domain-containing protein, partial [Escherichia coli]|nr:prophage tail fiber N-terminal domain-containing protein [Escherichia coli]ELS5853525.1 prophage tail fiber N-terminal domain-containing protein [Escherichia coli]